jgi:hypothetical protein
MKRFAIVIACLSLETVSAWAGSPPRLDINATCRRAVPLLGGSDNSPYQSRRLRPVPELPSLSNSANTYSGHQLLAKVVSVSWTRSISDCISLLVVPKAEGIVTEM